MNDLDFVPTRFEFREMMHVAGSRVRLTQTPEKEVQQAWETLVPYIGKIPEQIGEADYGLCIGTDEGAHCFDYIAALTVSVAAKVPAGWSHIDIPAQNYAIFPHTEHVSRMRATIDKIFTWLASSEYQLAEQGAEKIHFLERYGENFNPETGFGDIEIWLPLKP